MQAKPQPQEGVTAGKLTFTSEPITFLLQQINICLLLAAHANPI